ncbi:ABC transporter substrate-binding protein [Xinfangfangia sp. CPCC 101601]|uniref:ABC transporter substrate-binding protein n=1 Tax=Pseudogemmobacter lacusdianii TaxID=3069608 RepID=A0ABU0W2F0_9RHOB|nr:ABC transporter substrate-binding protein [Xinfangfangia sp. CPCC 101601]MDQ2068201.1 ABC transporter substrate-binding protein [Xinfangfangia sp. CPCC 101601]
MQHLRSTAAVIAVLASGAFAAPAFAQSEQGVLIARDMDLNSLDPARAFCDTCQIYLSAVYARLVDLDADGKSIKPMLAESWEIDAEQKVFTFKLRADAVFSDGSPVEAKDVIWSLNRTKNITAGAGYLLAGVVSLEEKDARTVVITLEAPNSELLGVLSAPYMGILNADAVSAQGGLADAEADAKDTAEAWLLENSAGAGPFVLESYTPGDSLRLKRNDSYFGDKAKVEAVTLVQSKDAASQLQLVQSGGADLAMQVDALTAAQVQDDRVKVLSMPSQALIYLALAPGAKGLDVPLNAKIRQAISHAIDYDALIDLTVDGKGHRMASPVPVDFPGGDNLTAPAYDVELAKSLLAEGGAADGFSMVAAFPNVRQYGVDFPMMMQKIQMDLAKIGVQLELEPLEFPIWRERVNGDGIPMTAVFFVPDFYGSSQYFLYFGMIDGTIWHSRAGAGGIEELARPQAQAIIDRALGGGAEESAAAFAELSQMMIDDKIILPLVAPDTILVSNPKLEGTRISSCCNIVLQDLHWAE